MTKIACALTIAGSDSGGGAGIQADLKTFAALGVHGVTAITSITAQNTMDVYAVQDVEPDIIKAQIESVVSDIGVQAAKTGMLHTRAIIRVVAEQIEKFGFPTVVDPVMIAKSGAHLLQEDAATTLVQMLLPLATVVTPNAMEATVLSGITVTDLDTAKAAAKEIGSRGPQAVVVKGGHIEGDTATDVLFHKDAFQLYEAERLDARTTHGTGCSFSSAIAAELAKGTEIHDAVRIAKGLVNRGIRYGVKIGHGYGPVNPMAHLYNEAEKYAVLSKIREAIQILENHNECAKLIPESQTNIVMVLHNANTPQDVAGVLGRIVKVGDRVKASSCPEFGASSHVARTVLVASQRDETVRSAMNIRYSETILTICKRQGLIISSYDRREEPPEIKQIEGRTTSWGAEQAIQKIGQVPHVIYHLGDWGKEPMLILLGKSPADVVWNAIKIAQNLEH